MSCWWCLVGVNDDVGSGGDAEQEVGGLDGQSPPQRLVSQLSVQNHLHKYLQHSYSFNHDIHERRKIFFVLFFFVLWSYANYHLC